MFEVCAASPRGYVTLDDLDQREIAQTDPALFLQMHKPPVIIDEVQYAPQLFNYIKIAVDREKEPGMFWLTGSQKFHLMKGVTESLAGRVVIMDVYESIWRGSFPKIVLVDTLPVAHGREGVKR